VDLGLSEEQVLLQDSARDFLERECPMSLVRDQMAKESPFPNELWQRMAELGWIGLVIPEKYGGSGLGFLDLAVLLEEMGRVLCPVPFLSTAVIGALAIQRAGSDEQREYYLPRLARGEIRTALAQAEDPVNWDCSVICMKARNDSEGYRLSGRKLFVADACSSDLLIVPVRIDAEDPRQGISLLLIDPGLPGITVRPIDWNEQTREMAEIQFDDVEVPVAARLGPEGGGWSILEELHDAARVALCAELCGAAEKVLEVSVEYAKTREQFDQPIGRFQALQHHCADMLVQSQAIRSAAYYAAWALQEEEPDGHQASCLAKAFCTEAYVKIAGAGIQIHGGLGFTWEQDLHLYFKHARAAELAYGSPAFHRELAARELLD
jgi:alkylation response protein AidB-like acyl-CoA dehydrogenase